MIIDARKRFARRSAGWMLTSGLGREELAKRLRSFTDEHVKLINQQAREIRGKPPANVK